MNKMGYLLFLVVSPAVAAVVAGEGLPLRKGDWHRTTRQIARFHILGKCGFLRAKM